MKKFLFMLIAMFTLAIGANAQNQKNVAGTSEFTDNWKVTLQGGAVTTFDNFFDAHPAMTPVVVLGADKYITPAFGVGIDARTAIGTGCETHNPHTAFDVVNVSAYGKVNLANLGRYNGTRKFFEPVVYAGLGWGHNNCSAYPALSGNYNKGIDGVPTELYGTYLRNYVTARAGLELNFNIGKEKAWGIVVNPSVVWGNIDNARLCKQNGNFELTVGACYYFKNSNKKRCFSKAEPIIVERVKEVPLVKEVVRVNEKTLVVPEKTYAVSFAQNSAVLDDTAKGILNKIPKNATVNIAGSTSPEGTSERNTELAQERAEAVATYLKSRGVKVNTVAGGDAGRAAVITVQ